MSVNLQLQLDVNKQAWPQGIPMTRLAVLIDVDGQTVRIPAQGTGSMFHSWLAWLPPEKRAAGYKLMNAGLDCYGTYQYLMGKGKRPMMRRGAV